MLMVILLLIPGIFCIRPEIQQIGNAGILFEQMGSALVYQSKWTLVTQVKFSNETEVVGFIENCDKIITEMCNILRAEGDLNNSCIYWHEQIARTVKGIKDKLDSIEFYSSKLRTRREILDGVGRISKFLFGTMDDRDAKNIYNRLESLEAHDKENLHLISKQITIVKSRFNTVDTILQNLTHHQLDLEQRLVHFSERLSLHLQYVTAEIQKIHIQTRFNEITILMLLKLQQVYFHLAEEDTIFTTLHQKKLHPAILSGQDLSKAYQEIMKINHGHPLLNDLTLLSQVINLDYFQINNRFLIRIQIPLTEAIAYTINKIYLLPIPISKTQFYFLDIHTNYLFNNTRQRHYLEFSEQDFAKKCDPYTSTNYTTVYICQQTQPKFIGQDKNNCLINVFDNPFSDQPSCLHRITDQNKDFFIKMIQKNVWLYNFQQETSLVVRCKETNYRETLHGQGILTLKEMCLYQMGAFEIPFEKTFKQITPVREPDQSNIPVLLVNVDLLNKLDVPKFEVINSDLVHNSDYLNALKSSTKAIDELEKEINLIKLTRDSKQQCIQTHINSTISGFCVFFFLFLIMAYIRKRFSNTKLKIWAKTEPAREISHKEPKSSEDQSKQDHELNEVVVPAASVSENPPSRLGKLGRSFRVKI